jgi:endonuclease/exonuclease/phosphatase family metal-dependent hydrolase
MIEVAKDYPDVELSHMYVDNAAMQLVKANYFHANASTTKSPISLVPTTLLPSPAMSCVR